MPNQAVTTQRRGRGRRAVGVIAAVGALSAVSTTTSARVPDAGAPVGAAARQAPTRIHTLPGADVFAEGVAVDGVWDARTGAPLNKVLPGRPSDGEMYPTYLADGHTVQIASSGGAVYTMDTRPERWIETACAIAGRSLTEEEWSDAFVHRTYGETCPAPGQG